MRDIGLCGWGHGSCERKRLDWPRWRRFTHCGVITKIFKNMNKTFRALPVSSSKTEQFVSLFRESAPFIYNNRDRTFVIAFGGEVVADGKFVELIHDLNLLVSLGCRLVLVYGARPQVE